jgi:DNA-directed RNA polymerase subunit RPC12/RpoP
MHINLPDKSFVNIDITSYYENKFCDFTVNNLQYQHETGLYTIIKGKYDITQSLKDINTKTLHFVSDIKSLKFCERTKLVERSNKMMDKGFKYDINEYEKDPFIDISNENKLCSICQCDDTKDKMYYLCSTCNASYHLHCANTYIQNSNNQNKNRETIYCPNCRQ